MELEEVEYIYKYMTFEQFVDLIEMKRLYFTRITLWEDTYEGYPIKAFHEYLHKDKENISKDHTNAIAELEQKTSYAQSWTYSNVESDALWRIYSQQKTGVKIKIKKSDIGECISKSLRLEEGMYGNILEGNIEYGIKFNPEDYRVGKSMFETSEAPFLYIKREAFIHEAEYRFATTIHKAKVFKAIGKTENPKEFKQKVSEYRTPSVIYYNVPINIIQEIILDPRAPEYFEKTFNAYCENRLLRNHGTIFKKSNLYKLP